MRSEFVDLDVRPILRAGGEPFPVIIEAVERLEAGQALRLFATFEPVPLFRVLARKGFGHVATSLEGGDWEVIFTPIDAKVESTGSLPPRERAAAEPDWPPPSRHLDNRELDPPEPMVRTLAAIEGMQPGEVLSALLCREPQFLLPELRSRGHAWRGGFEPDGTTFRLLVRVGSAREDAA